MRERPKFVFQPITKETAKKRATQKAGMFDSFLLPQFSGLTVKEGGCRIRLMPGTWENSEHFGFDIFIHYNIGDNGSYLCAKKMLGKPCCVCEEEAALRKDGQEQAANEIKPNKRVLCWVIDRAKQDDGPLVYAMPWTMDRDITARMTDKETGEILQIHDPDNGYDVTFEKTGKGINTKYIAIEIARRPTPLSDDQAEQDKWLQYVVDNPLPDVLNYEDQDYIYGVLTGKTDKEEAKEKPAVATRHVVEEKEETPPSPRRILKDDEPAPPRRPVLKDDDEPTPVRVRTREVEAEVASKPRIRGVEPVEEAPPRRTARTVEEDDAPRPRTTAKPAEVDDDDAPRPRTTTRRAVADD